MRDGNAHRECTTEMHGKMHGEMRRGVRKGNKREINIEEQKGRQSRYLFAN